MSVFQGDFLGFTLGEMHSSQLNITRVSSSDRYNDTLIPNFKDVTAEVPGGDGTYYWNSFYSQKLFTLDFAYDDLRDEDLRNLRQLFSFKTVQPLIFDEFPYKKYMVKVAAPPQFKYICFDYQDVRLYKGEGQVSLIAYYPFALATSPALLTNVKSAMLNNDGDMPAQLKLTFAKNNIPTSIVLKDTKGTTVSSLTLSGLSYASGDQYILINSYTHLIEGLNASMQKTGNLYNKFITAGDFFDVPLGRYTLTTNVNFYRCEYTQLYY